MNKNKELNVLIIKERQKPLHLRKLEALIRRLSKNHHSYQKVERDYKKILAGYKGEKSIDYFLSYLKEDYLLFHNIRLRDRQHYFQMDTLIVTASFVCILEVKNIAGSIYINEETDQMIRTLDGKEEGFLSPLVQVKRQQEHFSNWLKDHKFPHIPCVGFVVLSSPSTIIKSSESHNPHIIQAASIPNKIVDLDRIYIESKLKKISLNKLSDQLLNSHTENNGNILEHYQISKSDILTGVECLNCGIIPTFRSFGLWKCLSCRQKSKDAHFKAFLDYKLLISDKITNHGVRTFLHVNSRTSVRRILQHSKIAYEGKTKARVYLLRDNLFDICKN